MEPLLRRYSSQNLITVNQNDSLLKAYKKMQEMKIRHLPVVDDEGTIVGILSDRDLSRATLRQGNVESLDAGAQVKEWMSWPVEVASSESSLQAVAQRMMDQKISSLLIEGRQGQVVGIITTEDMLRALVNLLNTPHAAVATSRSSPLSLFWPELAN
jgi:CBS domain-containing protein